MEVIKSDNHNSWSIRLSELDRHDAEEKKTNKSAHIDNCM